MDWMGTLKVLAPTVATALGTPLSGAIVLALGELFGMSEPSQEKIQKVIEGGQLTSDNVFQLKQLEMKLKADEQERDFKYVDLEYKDRGDARKRDTEIKQAGGKNTRADVMFYLAVIVIIGLVYAVWSSPDLNEYVKGIVTFLLGRFAGYLDNIYNFEFGTTRANRFKDETINTMVTKQAGPG